MYKMNYGDFELKCKPCKYWFVRYANYCEYKHAHWQGSLSHLLRGSNDKMLSLLMLSAEMTYRSRFPLFWKIMCVISGKLFNLFSIDRDCSYENKDQRKCPNYQENEFTKDISLKEIQKWKGYDA